MTPASAVEATLDVTGAGGGVVAVRHNVNRGWRAESPDGSSAPPLVVDGWQQGWHVADDVESLDLRYVPDRAYRAALAVGGLLLVLLALGTLLLRRRRRRTSASGPEPCGTRVAPWVVPVAGVCALGLVGGWWGVAAAVAGAAASVIARRRVAAPSVAWVAGLPVVVAGLVYWWRPLGSPDGWAGALVLPQLLVAVALGALVSVDLDLSGHTSRRRRAGRSTAR